jgi:hypothetical protein
MIIPASASDVAGFIATAMSVLDRVKQGQAGAGPVLRRRIWQSQE